MGNIRILTAGCGSCLLEDEDLFRCRLAGCECSCGFALFPSSKFDSRAQEVLRYVSLTCTTADASSIAAEPLSSSFVTTISSSCSWLSCSFFLLLTFS